MSTTRRNGQLSSCEPCRKSKLRCDHSSPVCGRCVRRGQQDLCMYHPAPMTRLGLFSENRKRRHRPKENLQDSETWNQKKISASAPGFLGRTSYRDVFLENGSDLPTGDTSYSKTTDPGPIDAQRIRLGAQILMLLKDQDLYREIVEERYKIWRGDYCAIRHKCKTKFFDTNIYRMDSRIPDDQDDFQQC